MPVGNPTSGRSVGIFPMGSGARTGSSVVMGDNCMADSGTVIQNKPGVQTNSHLDMSVNDASDAGADLVLFLDMKFRL